MHESEDTVAKTLFRVLLTTLALFDSAAHSIFCRKAIKTAVVDTASFTAIRLVLGAATFWLLTRLRICLAARLNLGEIGLKVGYLARREVE